MSTWQPPVLAATITAAVAVVALIVTSIWNWRSLVAAKEALANAQAATVNAQAAAARAEVWRRFQWGAEAVTTTGNEARIEAGWAILNEVVADPWANADDKRMMGSTMTQLLRQQQTRETRRGRR
jgi:hypothetical protein